LEDVAELDRRLLEKLAVALRTRVAGICLPDVREDRVVVAAGLHTAQMPAVPVCARHELPIPQRLVRDNVDCYPNRSEGAPACAGAMNPDDSRPPMNPDSATTWYASRSQRSKMRSYACLCASKLLSSPASSRSNEYESFMMNSRKRKSPPRARGSSRSLVEKWYQNCGSCLYDCSSRAWNVMVSSCENGSTKSRPVRSFRLNTIGAPMRPPVCHNSAGVRTGPSIASPP